MKSALRLALRNQGPPVPLSVDNPRSFSLMSPVRNQSDSLMNAYSAMATVWTCVQLYASAVGAVQWNLYKSQPQDARRRYATTDTPSDQRVQVTQHPALSLISKPNPFWTRMQLFELDQTYLDLTGESYWVLDRTAGMNYPTGIWPVRPDRIDPAPSAENYLLGWLYSPPDGSEPVPLGLNQVIQVKYPNPMDPLHGLGPVQSILTQVDAYQYSSQWNRNFFLNSAQPAGVITLPGTWSDVEWKRFTDRWRETHRGVSRAHAVAVMEDGATWQQNQMSLRDMDFTNLQNLTRDTVREAFRMHKVMTGVSDDVNRANAQTGEEVFASWGVVPRLERKKDMLNNVLLPMFGTAGQGVEFDYITPVPANREEDRMQMVAKCTAVQLLIDAGFDPHDSLETVGLPDMDVVEQATQAPALPPAWVPSLPAGAPAAAPAGSGADDDESAAPGSQARQPYAIYGQADPATAAYQQQLSDYPPGALAWMHHATWTGPVDVPLSHVNSKMSWMDDPDPAHVQDFVKRYQKDKSVKPVILVKTPDHKKLLLADGHHRYLAKQELGQDIPAYVATVPAGDNGWQQMHARQYSQSPGSGGGGDNHLTQVLLAGLRPYTALEPAVMNRRQP